MRSLPVLLSECFASSLLAHQVHGYAGGFFQPENRNINPRIFRPVVETILRGTGMDHIQRCWDRPHRPQKTYLYHEHNNRKFDPMVNSRNGIRLASLSFGHPLKTVSSPSRLIQTLQKDGKGKCLIIGGGYAPWLGGALDLDREGVDAAAAKAIRDAVRDRGWTFIGDCAGAFCACACYLGYERKVFPGIGVAGQILTEPALDHSERGKMSAMELHVCDIEMGVPKLFGLFCDGPRFLFPSDLEYKTIAVSQGTGEPVLVSLKSGKGRIILSSVHFESVYLRGYDLAVEYKKIIDKHPELSPPELVEEMRNYHNEECPVEETPESGCGIADPDSLAAHWIVLNMIIKEMEDKDANS